MALHLNLDHESRLFLTLTCDGCSTIFLCFDDACYSFTGSVALPARACRQA